MAEFDWRHPDFSVRLLTGELPASQTKAPARGSSKGRSTKKSSAIRRSSSKQSSRPSRRRSINPGGNYNGKYGKGVYKRSAQINPEYYVDDLDEFLYNQADIERVKRHANSDIQDYKQNQSFMEGTLDALGNRYNNREMYDDGSGNLRRMTLADANEMARASGSPVFRYNNRAYETKFDAGDHLWVGGLDLGPVPQRTIIGQNVQKRTNYDGMGFNAAFAAARNAGLDVFNWRGKDYTTAVAGSNGVANTRGTMRRSASAPAVAAEPYVDISVPFIDQMQEPLIERGTGELAAYHDVFGRDMNNPYALHAYPDEYGWGGYILPVWPIW